MTEGFNVDVRELVQVVKSGNVELFLEYYLNLKNLINPSTGLCLLHEAVRSGDVAKVRYLIDEGAYLLALDGDGLTPMEVAIWKGKIDMLDCFLSLADQSGVGIDYIFPSGHTLLTRVMAKRLDQYWTTEERHVGIGRRAETIVERQLSEIELLLNRGASPFVGEPNAFKSLVNYFRNLMGIGFGGSFGGGTVAKRNELIRRILFPKSDRELVLPDHIDKKEILLLMMNDQQVPHRILNWMKFNDSTVRSWLMSSAENEMSLAEMIFLDSNYGQNFSTTILENLLSKGLIRLDDPLTARAKSMLTGRHDILFQVLEGSFEPSHLIEAIVLSDRFYSGQGIWGTMNRIETLRRFNGEILASQEWVVRLTKCFQYYATRSENRRSRVAEVITRIVIPELAKKGIDRLQNSSFECCHLIGFCSNYRILNPVLELVLKGLDGVSDSEKKHILDSNCDGIVRSRRDDRQREPEPCPNCGVVHGNDGSSSSTWWRNCGSSLRNALRNNNMDGVVLLLQAGADHAPIIAEIEAHRVQREHIGNLMKVLVEKGISTLRWSDLRMDYRFALSGDILKKIDEKDPSVFGLVQRQDPITYDDLQEIEDARLVIVNHVPWDIENLVQYITKVTRGENKFDPKHPLAGRQIWTGRGDYGNSLSSRYDELGCLYYSTIRIPDRNRQRVADLRHDYENVGGSAGGSGEGESRVELARVDREDHMRERLGLWAGNRNLPRTYGELLKSYLEVGGILGRVERADFEEIYRIGSILWARGAHWDKAIREKLNESEYQTWKDRYQDHLSFEEMPYSMPSGLKNKLHDLKLTQLANLDIWHTRMRQEKQDSLKAISEICYAGSDYPSDALSRMIERVLDADYCVMSFGSSICRGYLKCKTTWNRLEGY